MKSLFFISLNRMTTFALIVILMSLMSCVLAQDYLRNISSTSYIGRQDSTIKGIIADSSENTLPACNIRIESKSDPSLQYETAVDYDGYFQFASIKGGIYKVSLVKCMASLPDSVEIEVKQGQTRVVWLVTHYDRDKKHV